MPIILLSHFAYALLFLKEVKAGKIQRQQDADGYFWDSEQTPLSQKQLDLVADNNGNLYVWLDAQTNMSWFIKERLQESSYMPAKSYVNDRQYGGFSDWRTPTLRELKTLRSSEPDEFGVYVKDALKGRIKGNYRSCSDYENNDWAWWNFSSNSVNAEDYRDGKVIWDSEGEYAGMESGRALNSARTILVRGVDILHREDWAWKLIEWSEREKLFNFPVTQTEIEEITELRCISVRSLPPEISCLKKLRKLTCSNYPDIQDGLFANTGLTELNITQSYDRGHKIDALPTSLSNLQDLVRLDAKQIGLKSVHPAIGDLLHLEYLDLKWNQIESIPESIGNLCALKHLNLAGNEIEIIPESIGNLCELKHLVLAGNPLETIPESIGRLSSLKHLDVGEKKLRIIHKSIGNLSNLEQLYLKGCFDELPESVGSLRSLVNLNCSAPLTNLPESFLGLEKLETVNITGVYSEFVLQLLFKMHWLKGLTLHECLFQSIPDEISNLKSLERLDLSGTKIAELPRSIMELENLQTLVVSNTMLASLPEWLADMKSIKIVEAKGIKASMSLREKVKVIPLMYNFYCKKRANCFC